MTSVQLQKPIETIHPSNLPEVKNPELVAKALDHLVDQSTHHDFSVQHTIHAPMHKLLDIPSNLREKLKEYVPGLEKLASTYHIGNFVATRSGERFFETMPLYPRFVSALATIWWYSLVYVLCRLGMHLLFYGGTQVKILHNRTVESVLKDLSIRVSPFKSV